MELECLTENVVMMYHSKIQHIGADTYFIS